MIPLCHFQSSFEVLALCSHFTNSSGIWFLTSFHDGQWYSLLLLRAFVLVADSTLLFIRPTNVEESFLHPSSSHDQFPRRISVLISPRLVALSSQRSLDSFQSLSLFKLLTLVLRCPFLPVDHPGLLQKHLFYVLRADHSRVHCHLPFKNQGVPLRPLDAKIASLARDGSCRSSHLSPCLHFEDLFPPSLHVLFSPASQPDTFLVIHPKTECCPSLISFSCKVTKSFHLQQGLPRSAFSSSITSIRGSPLNTSFRNL